jgi:large subunit ribosomal protein L32e
MRLQKKGKPPIVKIGYRQPKVLRGLHPCGLKEILVRNLKDLERVDPSKEAIRLSSTLGKRKREQILTLAKERGIKVLNP